ncbi:hypothetical protein [Hyphococcus sp.]|uniref:hypothetical protein n=1 Tax=Hyphococcus sp. TaxID=2038636 RepID=UPI003CCBE187
MNIVKLFIAYLTSVIAGYALAVLFYTQQVIAKQAEIGAVYTLPQKADTFFQNLSGLWVYACVIAATFLIAFGVAFIVKRALKPLAPFAYPAAGAAGMFVMLILVEQQLGGGAGIIGGARDAFGVTLQCFAGLIGGLVFAMLRPR